MEQTTNAYWGMLIYDKAYCPFCSGHLNLRQQKYVKRPTTDSDYEEMDAHDYYCSNCKIGLVKSIYFNTYNYSAVNRYNDITNKTGLSLQRTKNFLTLSNDKWKSNVAFEIKSIKENRKPDEMFEIIFCNERRSTLRLNCSLLYSALISQQKNNNDNIADEGIFKLWGAIIQKYLPYMQTYQIPMKHLKHLQHMLNRNKQQENNVEYKYFRNTLKLILIGIVERSYFKINEETRKLYKELKKSRKIGDIEQEKIILKQFKDNYIKESTYLDSPLFVEVYNGNYNCELRIHRTEERTGFVKRVQDLIPIPVSLHYCKDCKKYSISRSYFNELRSQSRIYLFDIEDDIIHQNISYGESRFRGKELQVESIYKSMGYSVSKNCELSFLDRQRLIISFLESGFTTKARFSSFIEWLVKRNSNNSAFYNAIAEWKADLTFIRNYNIYIQEKEYAPLVFATKRVIEKMWKGESLYNLTDYYDD